MARALRAWAIKGRKKLGPQLAVRTSHPANKRYILAKRVCAAGKGKVFKPFGLV